MPDYTPHYLLPYVEDDDYLASYPSDVSHVLATRLDTALEDLRDIPDGVVSRAQASAGVSIASGSWQGVTAYDTTPILLGPITYAAGKFTITRAGIYTLAGAASFSAATAGRRGLAYTVNSAAVDPEIVLPAVVNSTFSMAAATIDYELLVGDTVQMRAFQDAGSVLQISRMRFTCAYRRDLA